MLITATPYGMFLPQDYPTRSASVGLASEYCCPASFAPGGTIQATSPTIGSIVYLLRSLLLCQDLPRATYIQIAELTWLARHKSIVPILI